MRHSHDGEGRGREGPDHAHGASHARDHDHDHGHGHHHHHAHATERALVAALVLSLGVTAGEFLAGHRTGSLALVADAWHMLSDAGSLVLALVANRWGKRARSPRKTFGYRRLEVLAALANGVLLGVASVLVGLEAVDRLRHPEEVHGTGVVVAGGATLAVNLLIAWVLTRGERSNVNVRAALAHVLGDAMGSGAAMLAGAIVLWSGRSEADPLLGLLVSAYLLWSAWGLVQETAHVLMEGTPEGFDPEAIERAIRQVPGVASVHDLHVWSIGAGEPAVSAHVVMAPGGHHGDVVARAVCDMLERGFHVRHSTIQPEPPAPGMVQLGRPRGS
jgi:cobalt-zinc-cadmium efflux system protein